MRRHVKAATAGSTMRRAKGLGRILRGAFAGRGSSSGAKGSGAPSRGRRGLVVLAALALVSVVAVPLFSQALAAPSEFVVRSDFGPDGTEATEFSSAESVAVDQQADVLYVLDRFAKSLYKFDLEGQPVPFGGSGPNISGNEISGLSLFPGNQVAVDSNSHGFYVVSNNSITAFQANGEPASFSAGPGIGTNAIGGFTRVIGVAVDANGVIYAGDRDAGVVKIFAPSGEEITQFSAPEAGNLAVDSNGAVYVNRAFNLHTILKYTPSAFPVSGATTYTPASQPLSPKDSYSLTVDRSTNEVYVVQQNSESKIAIYDEDGNALTSFGGAGQDGQLGSASSVAVDEGTGVAFVANRFADESNPSEDISRVRIFEPRTFFEGPPSVVSTSVADVSADSATLLAQINPNTADTTYHFEYGTEDCALGACTSVPLPDGSIAAGHDPVAVAPEQIVGLQADTTYHYRVVAENSFDPPTEGPDHTFRTQIRGLGFKLADRRAWEMVSPPKKYGGLIAPGLHFGQVQAAADGNGLAYLTIGSVESDPEGSRESGSAIARREGGGSWSSKDIIPPNDSVVPSALGRQSEYKLFSPDLSEALLEPRSGTPLFPEASGKTPYLRQNTEPPVYRPLLTDKEGFANVPLGTDTGEAEVFAATPGLDRLVLRTGPEPLAAGAPPGGVYEWSGGQLQLVSILPDGEGGTPVPGVVGSDKRSLRHAISADGSRVFWTRSSPGGLYVRDTLAEETVRIDLQAGGSGAGSVDPVFQGASADGSVVFFTDTQQLSADASPEGADLYRCALPSGCATLTDLSAPDPGESAEVQGMVAALSEDGSKLYFVAKGALDDEANEAGEVAVSGEPNLYLWKEGEGVRFIATLSDEDKADWGMPGTVPAPGLVSSLSAAASPSGRYLAFMSERSLTGEENLDAETGVPAERVFRYDAANDRLDCISCDPTGAAPEGQHVLSPSSALEFKLVDPRAQWSGRRVAAVLPESTILSSEGNTLYRPRAVQDSGRVFFNAFDSLVPADSNGEWDVYQYEPTGVGSCSASSGDAATSRSGDGCLSLLSSGTAEEAAAFFDASVSGDDVFFFTPAQLSVTDEDQEADIYDARVDGVPATLPPNTECLGEACQPAAMAPNDPTPASAGFKGAGDPKPNARKRCAKGKRAVRRGGKARCVPRKQRKQRGQAKRAGKSGRASR